MSSVSNAQQTDHPHSTIGYDPSGQSNSKPNAKIGERVAEEGKHVVKYISQVPNHQTFPESDLLEYSKKRSSGKVVGANIYGKDAIKELNEYLDPNVLSDEEFKVKTSQHPKQYKEDQYY